MTAIRTRNSITEIMLYDIREQQVPITDNEARIKIEVEGSTENGEAFKAEAELCVPIKLY